MSAYICNPEHFGILAAFAAINDCVIYDWKPARGYGPASRIANAQAAAKGLAKENIRSVAHRYGDGELPGPCLTPAEIEEAAAIYAVHFVVNPQRLTPVQVFKLVQSLDYQSCETDDWMMTLAKRQLEWIVSELVRQMPGYDDADWSFDQMLPGIEALYEKED